MTNFFKNNNNNIDRTRPKFYDSIVTQEEYEIILDHSLENVVKLGEISSVSEGTITVKLPEDDTQEIKFHLDNLVRKCKNHERVEWPIIIEEHFARFPNDKSKEKYILKDLDFAKNLLRVSVRARDILSEEDIPAFISRVDIPGTYSFLILEYDEKFHFVRNDEIGEWEKPIDELFEIGLHNIALEEMDIKEYLWEDKFETFIFFSGDFSASFILELDKNASYSIGQFGSVVTIPTKGTAIVHPINSDTALDFIAAIGETQQQFYNEDEVPISDSFYWYYQGTFFLFPERAEGDKVIISYPQKLLTLLEESIG